MRKFSMPDWSFLLIILILSLTFLNVIKPFIIDIFIAAIMANQLWRFYKKLQIRLKSEKFAATVCVTLSVLFIILPLLLISYIVSNEAIQAVKTTRENLPKIQNALSTHSLQQRLQRIPGATRGLDYLHQLELKKKLYEKLPQFINNLSDLAQSALTSLYLGIFHFFIIILLLFFMFTDGEKVLARIKHTLPMNTNDLDELLQEIEKVTDGTIKGAFIVGIIEAVVGGIIFLICGIPSVFFWSIIMFIAAIIPAGGSGLIYVPVGLYLLAFGHPVTGAVLIVLAMLVPNGIQNIVKPKLVGDKIGLNPALLLLTTLGGLLCFGLIGFIIGPLVGALFVAVWRQFADRYQTDLLEWKKS